MTSPAEKKILLVDDEECIRTFCHEVLTGMGCAVEVASNGREALDKLKDQAYDLIISDIFMPEMNGMSFYQSVLKERPYLKERFLFITGVPVREVEDFLTATRSRYLAKPFLINELKDHVQMMTGIALEELIGKSPANARRFERYSFEPDCFVFKGGDGDGPIVSKAKDISKGGLRISFAGKSVDPGTPAMLHIPSLDVKRSGRIMWVRPLGQTQAVAGFCFDEPLDEMPNILRLDRPSSGH